MVGVGGAIFDVCIIVFAVVNGDVIVIVCCSIRVVFCDGCIIFIDCAIAVLDGSRGVQDVD